MNKQTESGKERATILKRMLWDLFLVALSGLVTYICSHHTYVLQQEKYRLNNQLNKANSYYTIGDYDIAFNMYSELSAEGLPAAQSNLGFMYEYGLGTTKDNKMALECYMTAYQNGCKKALHNYVALCIKEQVNRDELVRIFYSAYENHDKILMECAAACMDKIVYYEEPYLGEGFDYKFKNLDKYFPTFPDKDLQPVEDIIITTSYPLSEYANENGSRYLINKECTLSGCTYTYCETKQTWPFIDMLNTGIADNTMLLNE